MDTAKFAEQLANEKRRRAELLVNAFSGIHVEMNPNLGSMEFKVIVGKELFELMKAASPMMDNTPPIGDRK